MTPPTDRPDRRVTDTRQRLIDTTLELIDAHGRQEVTLTGVARACGVTTPACYKHFPSKTSLFNAAVRQLSSNLGEQAEQQLQDDPVESLLAIGMILINLAADHPHLFEFNQLSPEAVAALDDEVERLAARERADPERLQLIIWSCLQGYTRLIAVGAASADPDFIRAALHTVITIGDHS